MGKGLSVEARNRAVATLAMAMIASLSFAVIFVGSVGSALASALVPQTHLTGAAFLNSQSLCRCSGPRAPSRA